MDNNKSVHLAQIVDEFGLEIICRGSDYDDALLTIEDVNRPGLQFVGFFDYFDPRRLQVIGKAEITFLAKMSSEKRRESFEGLLSYDIPALVISRGMDVFPECLEMAEKYGRTLLRTQDTTVVFTSKMIDRKSVV